jgi:hypothetical protein
MYYFFITQLDEDFLEYYMIEANDKKELVKIILSLNQSIDKIFKKFFKTYRINYVRNENDSYGYEISYNDYKGEKWECQIAVAYEMEIEIYLKNNEKFLEAFSKDLVNFICYETKIELFQSFNNFSYILKGIYGDKITIEGEVRFREIKNIALFLHNCNNKEKNVIGHNFTQSKLFDKNVLGIINDYFKD